MNGHPLQKYYHMIFKCCIYPCFLCMHSHFTCLFFSAVQEIWDFRQPPRVNGPRKRLECGPYS